MTKPLISIVIPTYQHAHTILQCLDSIFVQTYSNIEIIVVNDGSTDNTEELLEQYKERITLVNQDNRGPNPARNRGFSEAKGDFIIFCDADIVMKPEMLLTLKNALDKNPEASYAYSSFKWGWKTFQGIPFDADRLKERNFVHTSALVRRVDFPGFDNEIKRLQDWDVWLTMLKAGQRGVLVPKILFSVSIDGKSRIGSSWLPSFMYKIPWRLLGFKPKAIKKYQQARLVIVRKHNL